MTSRKLSAKLRSVAKSRAKKVQQPLRRKGLDARPSQIEYIPAFKPISVRGLRTINDWHLLIGIATRRVARGQMPPEIGARLAYMARIGAEMAKAINEAAQFDDLRTKLAALHGQQLPALGLAQADQEGGTEVISGDLVGPEGQEQTP